MAASDDPIHYPSSIKIDIRASSEVTAHVDSLLRTLETTGDPVERAKLLVTIAIELRDGLDDAPQALDALLEAWHADPTNPQIIDHLEPLARAQGRWNEIFEATRTLVASEHDPARAIAYSEAMVRWLTREVPLHDHAMHYLERIRQLDSTHWLIHLFQAARYEERGDVKRELEELDRAVLSAKRADDRARIHVMMAKRYGEERTANFNEAKKHFSAAHRLAPGSMEALRGLEQVYVRENNLSALADVLERQVDATLDERERVQILFRLAELYEKEFLQPAPAAAKLEQAFALDPTQDAALAGLERCYTALRSWDDLVRVLEAALVLVENADERAERLVALAEIFESRLGDVGGAVSAYERLARLLPGDETLVAELARLNEKLGDWRTAAQYRAELAELAPDPKAKARSLVLAGQLVLPHAPTQARAYFEKAIACDATSAAAWNALDAEARDAGDLPRVTSLLARRALATEAPRAKAQLYLELGNVKQELGDRAGALVAWEVAIAADPNNEQAARILLDVYVEQQRWQDAAPLCDAVIYAAHRDQDTERLFTVRRQACVVATRLGRTARALDAALDAFAVPPEMADVRRTVVECAWALRADPAVFHATQALTAIADDTDGLPVATRAQLGEVLALIGERDRAIDIFDHVLSDQNDNQAALAGLAGLRAERGESIAAWSLKRQLAGTVADDEQRYRLLLETASGFAENANRPDLAAQVFEEARLIRPSDRSLLHKLLFQYQSVENWPKVFGILRAIADHDPDRGRKAKVVVAMAQLAQEKLGDQASAVKLYDEVLDTDPTRLEAFEALVRVLTTSKDWMALARAYKRMLARVREGGDARLLHALHHQLGLVYRDRLGDRESAVASFRDAVALRPDSEADQTILRELLAMSGQAEHAIALTIERVRRDTLDPAPYPALYDLLVQLGHRDRAYCVASVMVHLGTTHAPAIADHRAAAPPYVERFPGTLGPSGWRRLLHPDIDPTLTAIFEAIVPAVIQARLARLGLRERLKYPGPVLKQPEFLMADLARASFVLGLEEPKLYAAAAPPAVSIGVTEPPSLLVHPQSLPGFPRHLLSFWIGKRLAETTPPLLARGLFRSVSELKDLIAAAVRLVRDKRDKNARYDEALRAQLGKEQKEALAQAVERAISAGSALDVKRWSQLADASASRAGLVLTGDVESARLALMREAQSPGDLSPREQMRELVTFFLSDAYARMRAELGVART